MTSTWIHITSALTPSHGFATLACQRMTSMRWRTTTSTTISTTIRSTGSGSPLLQNQVMAPRQITGRPRPILQHLFLFLKKCRNKTSKKILEVSSALLTKMPLPQRVSRKSDQSELFLKKKSATNHSAKRRQCQEKFAARRNCFGDKNTKKLCISALE